MAGKRGRWRTALVLGLVLLVPTGASAGPYFGEWGLIWHEAKNCPRGVYSPLHYWAPALYYARYFLHPSNLDQYSPGPTPSPPVQFEDFRFPCRSLPPRPTSPYADPTAYYGRPLAPP
jgi:hypothetical protein